jgi:hypothetical protein
VYGYTYIFTASTKKYIDNPPRHLCLPRVLISFGNVGVLSASVLLLWLQIVLGWRTLVSWEYEAGSIPEELLRGQGGFFSTRFYFWGEGKGGELKCVGPIQIATSPPIGRGWCRYLVWINFVVEMA